MSLNYKQAGVDIDAGNNLIEKIKPFAKATARIGSNPNLGGFGALFDLAKCNFKDPVLVSSTDGVGTKLKIAIETNQHNTIGIDLVAMSVNDLVVQGAEPLFFLDYFACGKLNVETASQVIAGIAEGCKQANCALIGGETAEMPSMYHNQDYDLAGFAVGAVERNEILPKTTQVGDVLLGLASSGLHSNGYSLARYILAQNNLNFQSIAYNNQTFGEVLLTPTKALAHITGGGLTENLPRVLAQNTSPKINYQAWPQPEIFKILQKLGKVTDSEMLRTFNCGIGMVLVVDKNHAHEVASLLKQEQEQVFFIGELI